MRGVVVGRAPHLVIHESLLAQCTQELAILPYTRCRAGLARPPLPFQSLEGFLPSLKRPRCGGHEIEAFPPLLPAHFQWAIAQNRPPSLQINVNRGEGFELVHPHPGDGPDAVERIGGRDDLLPSCVAAGRRVATQLRQSGGRLPLATVDDPSAIRSRPGFIVFHTLLCGVLRWGAGLPVSWGNDLAFGEGQFFGTLREEPPNKHFEFAHGSLLGLNPLTTAHDGCAGPAMMRKILV